MSAQEQYSFSPELSTLPIQGEWFQEMDGVLARKYNESWASYATQNKMFPDVGRFSAFSKLSYSEKASLSTNLVGCTKVSLDYAQRIPDSDEIRNAETQEVHVALQFHKDGSPHALKADMRTYDLLDKRLPISTPRPEASRYLIVASRTIEPVAVSEAAIAFAQTERVYRRKGQVEHVVDWLDEHDRSPYRLSTAQAHALMTLVRRIKLRLV